MAVRPISRSTRVGEKFETLTAGAYTLYDRSGKPATCARRIQCLAATTITVLKDPGEIDSPPGAVAAGTVIDADVSAITFTGGPVLALW
jgi:hypothetical protein